VPKTHTPLEETIRLYTERVLTHTALASKMSTADLRAAVETEIRCAVRDGVRHAVPLLQKLSDDATQPPGCSKHRTRQPDCEDCP